MAYETLLSTTDDQASDQPQAPSEQSEVDFGMRLDVIGLRLDGVEVPLETNTYARITRLGDQPGLQVYLSRPWSGGVTHCVMVVELREQGRIDRAVLAGQVSSRSSNRNREVMNFFFTPIVSC